MAGEKATKATRRRKRTVPSDKKDLSVAEKDMEIAIYFFKIVCQADILLHQFDYE